MSDEDSKPWSQRIVQTSQNLPKLLIHIPPEGPSPRKEMPLLSFGVHTGMHHWGSQQPYTA